MLSNAQSRIMRVKLMKFSFLATKSVSQFKLTSTPFLPSARASTQPSFASRSARLLATSKPFLRIMSTALSKSPSASCRAFLQSIMPALVAWRNFITSAAFISIIVNALKIILLLLFPRLLQLFLPQLFLLSSLPVFSRQLLFLFQLCVQTTLL